MGYIVLHAMREDEELFVSISPQGLSIVIAGFDDDDPTARLLLNQNTPIEKAGELVESAKYALDRPQRGKRSFNTCWMHNHYDDPKAGDTQAYFRHNPDGPGSFSVFFSLKNPDGPRVFITLTGREMELFIGIVEDYFELNFQTQPVEEE